MSSKVLEIANAAALRKQMFATAPERTIEERLQRLENILLPELKLQRSNVFHIRNLVALKFRITVKQLISRDRTQHIAEARFVGIYLTRRAGFYLKETAGYFGLKDVGAVYHAEKRIKEMMETEPKFKSIIESLEIEALE